VNLGYLYARGQGVAKNQPEAFRLYLLSAKQGNAEGMNAVGYKYRYGTGIKRDIGQAVHWFCRAAVSGDPRGLNNLGILYLEGTGVERDIGEARRLWQQAAVRGNPNAMQNLGQSLLGPDEPTDRNEGARWLIASARLGNGNAQRILRQLGYRDSLPPVVDTEREMRRALGNLPPGKARDCGFLVS
jgi:TPR repeat protein